MTDLRKEDIEFVHRLRNHPRLRAYFDEMLETAELKNESIKTADDAEDLVVAQIRKTGQEMLRTWAQGTHDRMCLDALAQSKTRTHQKKRSSGTPHSETSQLKNKDC